MYRFPDWPRPSVILSACFKCIGSRIDHAHHANKAKKALYETLSMEDAVRQAVEMTDEEDTLIVVTADHSHVFNIAGYPTRGTDILGRFRR